MDKSKLASGKKVVEIIKGRNKGKLATVISVGKHCVLLELDGDKIAYNYKFIKLADE